MLERGIAVRQGLRFLRAELPGILATRTNALSPRMLRILENLSADWRRLDARIADLSSKIEALARQEQGCERLMSVPGIGPIISSAIVAAIGTGDAFRKAATSAHGSGSCRNSYRPATARSLAAYEARQSLFAQSVRSGRSGRVGQDRAKALGPLRASVVDRGRKEASTPQRAGDRTR